MVNGRAAKVPSPPFAVRQFAFRRGDGHPRATNSPRPRRPAATANAAPVTIRCVAPMLVFAVGDRRRRFLRRPMCCGRAGRTRLSRSTRRRCRSWSPASPSTSSRRPSACGCSAAPARRSASISPICGPRSRRPIRRSRPPSARRSIRTSGCSSPSRTADGTLPLIERVRDHLSALSGADADGGTAGPDAARLPRRHALPRRGARLRVYGAGAFPGPLLAQGRGEFRHLPVGAARRRRRHHHPLSARLARGLEKRRRPASTN